MTVRRSLREAKEEGLATWLKAQGQPAFRERQIGQWLDGKFSIRADEMTNLPAALREALARDFAVCSVVPVEELSSADATRKWLLELQDGETVETVLIPAPDRLTVCISTQVGCPVRCSFCASGRHGLVRDLTAAEIVDQVVFASHEAGRRVDNIVVMGIGEPLLNLDAVLPALDTICSTDRGLGVGARHITVSTSGIVPGIRRLAKAGRQWNLALSLHGVTDERRGRLIPSAHRYPLAEILQACREYREQTGRMVTLEYALIAGENDGEQDMARLAGIATGLRAKVNLIPCNVSGAVHRASAGQRVRSFHDGLLARGVQATVRRRKGADIQAACGQLRAGRKSQSETE